MTEHELRHQYEVAKTQVRLWCDEYHAHRPSCLEGNARDIALIVAYERLESLRKRVGSLKATV